MYRVAVSQVRQRLPFAATALVAACSGGGGAKSDAPNVNFDRNALLAHLANNILLPIQAEVVAKTASLPDALESYCVALDVASPGAIQSARAKVDEEWRFSIDAWERAEEVLIGPAAMDLNALRDRIYAWPALAPCEIDRDVVSHWNDPSSYDLSTKLGRQRSLSAIEYLIYAGGTNHNCAVEPAGWSTLAAGPDLEKARCRLAKVLATDVAAAAVEVHTAWKPVSEGGGGYADELARAGQGSSLPSAHEAVNLLTNSFFYVDRIVKDMKLAEAAGISLANSCGTMNEPCVREVELRYADRATFAIRINLATLREAVTGTRVAGPSTAGTTLTPTDGPGFDAFLTAVGHPELAESMTADLDAAIAKATALPDSFLGALTSNYAAVVDTHAAIKMFTNDLKTQFLTVLALDIPDDVASDND